MQQVNWPENGNRSTYRKYMWASVAAGLVMAASLATVTACYDPSHVALMLPVITGMLIIWGGGCHMVARRRAQSTEIVRSFAGLSVLHHGTVIRIDSEPLLGDYSTRREAARTALERGHWAVIVRAYGRWFLLSGAATAGARTPVSFRTRAVADIVPSVMGDALSA